MPDAGGMVIASDQETARAYAGLLKKISGESPTVVLSDEKGASKKIATFTESDKRWLVAVRMVSEGVDVPRLAVGVWATTTSTPLFFAQAVGRFVRARSRGETASVFLPSVPHLLEFASDMEAQRDHVLGRRVTDEDDIFAAEDDLLAAGQRRGGSASDELEMSWEALGSTASFDHVLYEGAQFGHSGEVLVGSEEEMDFLGIPGLLEPDQVRELLHSRQSERARKQKADGRRRPGRRLRRAAQHPPAARRAAPRAQRARRRLAPPHRAGARHHPLRAPQGVRRPARRGRQRRPARTSGSTGSASGRCARPPDAVRSVVARLPPCLGDLPDARPRPPGAAGAGGEPGGAHHHRAVGAAARSTARSSTG